MTVADDGAGISLEDMTNHVLRMGGQGSDRGRLNEHGWGLKNSLCVLTGNKDFSIVTRDQVAQENDLVYLVKGPFRLGMKLEQGTEVSWAEGIFKCRGRTGTRVRALTTMHYFRTLYPSAARFDSLIERLIEHLGVIYRGYLINSRNEIWLRWRDVTRGSASWTDEKVVPIDIPFNRSSEEKIEIDVVGTRYSAVYKWGELDYGAIKDGSRGRPFPLKIYYQANLRSQGIDVAVRGRVILPHALEHLWPDLNRHNDFNKFTGELRLDDPIFATVNNKTQLDPNSPAWESLLERFNTTKHYKPERSSITYAEEEIRRELLAKLPNVVSGSVALENFPTWPGLGVKIDILHRIGDDHEEIYELKAGTAHPADVYQLIMYWDGRVEEGVRPKLGRLVAGEGGQAVLQLIEYWNGRRDKGGQPYVVEFKRVDELM